MKRTTNRASESNSGLENCGSEGYSSEGHSSESYSPKSHSPKSHSPENCDLEAVLSELEHGDFQGRWEAAKQLPQFGAAVIPALVELLQTEIDLSQDWELLWFIARILGSLNHPTAVELLVKLLQSTHDPDILAIATTALANAGEAALPALGHLLTRPATRLVAVKAMGQIQHAAIVPLLLDVAADPLPEIRVAVLEALHPFGGEPISALLWSSLQDRAAPVRRAAVIALGLQAQQQDPDHLVTALQPLLADTLDVACQTALTLGRIGTEPAINLLAATLESAPTLLKLEIVRALAWTENSAALLHLQTYLVNQTSRSEQPEEQRLTQEIIAVLGRVAAAPMRPAAAQILLDLLQTNSVLLQTAQTKQQVALSLGQLGEISALNPLIDLLANPDLGVRLHTIAALKQLAPETARGHLLARLTADATSPELKQGIQLALQEW
jgi:HEAT repeat protein